MKLIILSIILFCFVSPLSYAAKIYRWVGPDGEVHYSSTPPPEVEAKSTGMETEKNKPREEQSDSENTESLTDEERIRRLEEKIKQLEEENVATEKIDRADHKDADSSEVSEDEVVAEEDKKPDYSVQGQVRMLEEKNRIERMKVRCNAKAPHGADCNNPATYEQYQ